MPDKEKTSDAAPPDPGYDSAGVPTFESVRENLVFLKNVTGDGRAAATFSRMLPYGGTPIHDALRIEGRLRGDLTQPDAGTWQCSRFTAAEALSETKPDLSTGPHSDLRQKHI